MHDHQLDTKRLLLRLPCETDLDVYMAYCLSPRTQYVGGPFNRSEAFEKLAAMIGHWHLRGFGRFVFVDKATLQPIGHVGALQTDSQFSPEFTWTIWKDSEENKGYAFEACQAFRVFAASELGFKMLTAHIVKDNLRSISLAEKLGGTPSQNTAGQDHCLNLIAYDIPLDGTA